MFPDMLVLLMLRLTRFERLPMLSGRGPVKLLWPSSRYWRPVWLPREGGRVPVSWFPPAWMTWQQVGQAASFQSSAMDAVQVTLETSQPLLTTTITICMSCSSMTPMQSHAPLFPLQERGWLCQEGSVSRCLCAELACLVCAQLTSTRFEYHCTGRVPSNCRTVAHHLGCKLAAKTQKMGECSQLAVNRGNVRTHQVV